MNILLFFFPSIYFPLLGHPLLTSSLPPLLIERERKKKRPSVVGQNPALAQTRDHLAGYFREGICQLLRKSSILRRGVR
ncbi:hypothetical protein QBC38DRAFT_470967 [Podospora fimiseda]|uniref:Secreted protein n=1 Tax=Podospora fimiseda TaxID=252190 RepID=A0AAN7BUS0_9PEZI|nr:hypothetical protein QBC38DRAFT_470967 [Podospora fimiseda]